MVYMLVELLVHYTTYILKLAGGSLLLGTGLLLSIEAAGAAVKNLIAL